MILLDENMDEEIPACMPREGVHHVAELGWRGTPDGGLFSRAAEVGCTALIAVDENMPRQQNMRGRPFCLIVLDIHPNRSENEVACIPKIREILATAEPGVVYVVEGPHPKRDRA